MYSAATIRLQIETALAHKIPSALTPAQRLLRPTACVGIAAIDALLEGGLPLGAITEMVGPESSGKTSFALSFLSKMTQSGKVCAWIDVSDAFHPESAATESVDLSRLLWIRCGVSSSTNTPRAAKNRFAIPEKYLITAPIKKGLHGGGGGPHPRNEVKGLSKAVGRLLRPETTAPRCAEPQPRVQQEREVFLAHPQQSGGDKAKPLQPLKPLSRIEQALRVTDLLVQAGGFSAIVLDMGSVAPEYTSRVPLATWFRYRAAAEKTQASIVLINQYACAKSAAGLVLHLPPGTPLREEKTIFAGMEYRVEVARERFKPVSTNVIPLHKPPKRASEAAWSCRLTGTGSR